MKSTHILIISAVAFSFSALRIQHAFLNRHHSIPTIIPPPNPVPLRGVAGSKSMASNIPSANNQALQRKESVIVPWAEIVSMGGNTKPRDFFLQDPSTLAQNLDTEEQKILSSLEGQLCMRSKKHDRSQKCGKVNDYLKCATCSPSDGAWYSVSSRRGMMFGKVEDGQIVQYQDSFLHRHRHFDIGVPAAGNDAKLRSFAQAIGSSITKFKNKHMSGADVTFRLLVTRFAGDEFDSDEAMKAFQSELANLAGFDQPEDKDEDGDSLEFVPVNDSVFNRAKAINALHAAACHSDECILACIDADLEVGSRFLSNALAMVVPRASAYFPIFWSEYNPETVRLVADFDPARMYDYSQEMGFWRVYSYGMYAIAGVDAKNISIDKEFNGWGGEDNYFHKKVKDSLNVVRMWEKGMIHPWHPKDCTNVSTFFGRCFASKEGAEGSQLGLRLRELKREEPETFDAIMKPRTIDDTFGATMKPRTSDAPEKTENANGTEQQPVLLAVVTSRRNLGTRVPTILKTWGHPSRLPKDVSIKFFVGGAAQGDGVEDSGADPARLAREAGIEDQSMIHVVPSARDDEDPPVRKNAAIIKELDRMAFGADDGIDGSPGGFGFGWIMRVEDDAYVNVDGLVRFLSGRNSTGYRNYGEWHTKRLLPVSGAGSVWSRSTFQRGAAGIDGCVEQLDLHPYRDDVWTVDGLVGCVSGSWSDEDYGSNRLFRSYGRAEHVFVADSKLDWIVTVHPFAEGSSMEEHHARYLARERVVR